MSKHSRTTPPAARSNPAPDWPGPSDPAEPTHAEFAEPTDSPPPGEFFGEVNAIAPEDVAPPRGAARDPHDPTGLNIHRGDCIDRAGALRAQYERTAGAAIHAELSEAAADLLAEFDRDMKAYRGMLLDALGPILPAYVPTVRVGAVSVRDTFRGAGPSVNSETFDGLGSK